MAAKQKFTGITKAVVFVPAFVLALVMIAVIRYMVESLPPMILVFVAILIFGGGHFLFRKKASGARPWEPPA